MVIRFNGGGFGPGFPNFGGEGSASPFGGGNRQPAKPRKGIRSPVMRVIASLIVTLIFAGLYYYVMLPPLNFQSGAFYTFLIVLCVVYSLAFLAFMGTGAAQKAEHIPGFLKKNLLVPTIIVVAVVVIGILGSLSSWVVLRAGSYAELLPVDFSGDFANDVEEISFDQIPLLDSDSAQRLGNRKLGELSDMVSQFEVANDYTQINYKNVPVRVTPLVYGDIIKWFNNRAEGIPAYLIIDMTTSNVDVVRLQNGGIKYTTAEHFNRNLYRHLRFNYPTYLFSEPAFEIDEEGNPYWVCGRIDRTIGLFGGTDICGAVLVNAVTGECTYYDVADVPSWVDRVFNAELIMGQYDYYGQYHNGFINSFLGQRDVTVTTAGYNYIALNDDVYMYTGVTSVGGDESNVGFLLCNQRTKECKYYACAGAEEYSAMESAEGIVQQMKYVATFPILLNISDQPTYFMSLKDSAGLVKQYAMVNMSQYQIVANGTTVQGCLASYLDLMEENGLTVTTVIEDVPEDEASQAQTEERTGVVADIRSAVVDGNTWYYLALENGQTYYSVSAARCETAVLLNPGDTVKLTYVPGDSAILPVEELELLAPAAEASPAQTPAE